MNCIESIEEHLRDNDYDGLTAPYDECQCWLDDLICCKDDPRFCTPGYEVPCPGKRECNCGESHISTQKPDEK